MAIAAKTHVTTAFGAFDAPLITLEDFQALWDSTIDLQDSTVASNFSGTSAPDANNDINDSVNASNGIGFVVGSLWMDTTSSPKEAYRCADNTDGAAIWLNTSLEIGDLGSMAIVDSPAPVANGGTGSTTQGGARTNLGLEIGTNVQAFNSNIQTHVTGNGADHADVASNTTHRGLTSGNPHGVTPTDLGLVIGTNVQAFGEVLNDFNTLGAPASDGQFIVATGAGVFAYESGATVRASLGLEIGVNVQAFSAATVIGPGSATADGIVVFSGTGGNLVKDSSAQITSNQILAPFGTAAAPSYGFKGESPSNSGMFLVADDNLGFAITGIINLKLDSSGKWIFSNTGARILMADGLVGSPAYQFLNDQDTGIRRAGADDMRFVAGAADRVKITTGGLDIISGDLKIAGTTRIASNGNVASANGVASFSGAITNLTVVNGIVTAAS